MLHEARDIVSGHAPVPSGPAQARLCGDSLGLHLVHPAGDKHRVSFRFQRKGDQVPMYVGQSSNILAWLGTHLSDPAKRHRVRWVTLIHCCDGRQMDKTETRLIRKYRPELNSAGIPAGEYP